LELLAAYKRWVGDYIKNNWQPYYLSFMFHQLPGSQASVLRQMTAEILRVYRRLPTHFSRNPKSLAGSKVLPRMILFPDLPVYKHEKKFIDDVSINDGLHYGGIALTPPISRFQSTLDAHFATNEPYFIGESWRAFTSRRLLAILTTLSTMLASPTNELECLKRTLSFCPEPSANSPQNRRETGVEN